MKDKNYNFLVGVIGGIFIGIVLMFWFALLVPMPNSASYNKGYSDKANELYIDDMPNFYSENHSIKNCIGIYFAGEIESGLSDYELRKKIVEMGGIKFPLTIKNGEGCPFEGEKIYYSIQDIPLENDCLDINETSCFIAYNFLEVK
jgi:hypothetical protein